MAVWWTKRSLPPAPGVMKPKPFSSLTHLTVPVAMMLFLRTWCSGATRRMLQGNDCGHTGTASPGSLPGLYERKASTLWTSAHVRCLRLGLVVRRATHLTGGQRLTAAPSPWQRAGPRDRRPVPGSGVSRRPGKRHKSWDVVVQWWPMTGRSRPDPSGPGGCFRSGEPRRRSPRSGDEPARALADHPGMSSLRRLRLGFRVGVAFAVLLAALAVTVVVGVTNLQALNTKSSSSALGRDIAAQRSVSEIGEQAHEAAHQVVRHL